MFKQERTKIFVSSEKSTLIIIDKSTMESSPETEMLSFAEGKGWVRCSEKVPFDTIINGVIAFKEEGVIWTEIDLPEFNGEN